jgi:hypothetical protein
VSEIGARPARLDQCAANAEHGHLLCDRIKEAFDAHLVA